MATQEPPELEGVRRLLTSLLTFPSDRRAHAEEAGRQAQAACLWLSTSVLADLVLGARAEREENEGMVPVGPGQSQNLPPTGLPPTCDYAERTKPWQQNVFPPRLLGAHPDR